nr:hypothetical protein [Lachnospiraceae bacterium]
MKNSFKRRLFILLIALSLIVTQNVSYVSADETVSDPLIISADNTELSTEPVSENKGDVIVSENVSSLSDDEAELPIQESLSDNEESADIVVSENEIENNDVQEEPVLMSLDSAEDNDTVSVNLSGNILNGMPEGFVLSESELLGKKRIN